MSRACLASLVPLVMVIAWTGSPAEAQEAAPATTLNPLHSLPKDKLTGFRDRPLFNPARMEPRAADVAAPVAAPVPQAAPPEPPPELRLVGIVSGPRDLAIVRPAAGGKTMVLATGDKVGAWSVTVRRDSLRLQSEGRSVDLALFSHSGAAPPGTGVADPGPVSVKGADAFPPTGDPPPPP